MSEKAESSAWSNEEAEFLDDIDQDIKLVSSASETSSNQVRDSWKVLQKGNPLNSFCVNDGNCQSRQSNTNDCDPSVLINQNSNNNQLDKLHYTSTDLSELPVQNVISCNSSLKNESLFIHSNSYSNLNSEKHSKAHKKYDHIESKVKQYFKVKHMRKCRSLDDHKIFNEATECMDKKEKDDYLEEINNRLTKELEEKTALLNQLQENYENLLLKYAEAQNKIDQLRLKSACDSPDCPTHSTLKQRTIFQLPLNAVSGNRANQESWDDGKCQRAVVAPFMKNNFQPKLEARGVKIDRPSSLPLEPNTKILERDGMKAVTPTDSEGVSSVVTSMSGHSKILNILDAQSPNGREPKLNHYPERDFILKENSAVNDAFDKVKNWQNSLPPLEFIEKPETTLYDEPPNYLSPKENHVEDPILHPETECNDIALKNYLRTLPPPNVLKKSLTTKQQRRMCSTEDRTEENVKNLKDDIPSGCIIQRPKKKPPLLRCSSLPTYDYDSPKSGNFRNVYIPHLDLENLTFSDVESSQVDYDYEKSNRVTSSYITSQSGSMDFSSHAYRSVNSFRGRQTEYEFSPRPSFNKSTSITPDRCNEMSFKSRFESRNLCRVCGEKLVDPSRNFPFRSTSYQSFPSPKDPSPKSSDGRGKYPFNRSVSFNWETGCSHSRENFFHRQPIDSLEKFDAYASNLKARSQVIMKALAAHVHNT